MTPKEYKIQGTSKINEDLAFFRIKCNLNPMPGQFLEVSLPGIGECPLASASYNQSYVDLIVRKAGNVTSALFQLKKRDSIFVRGPYGKGFPLDELNGKEIILASGGTGAVPISSLIDYCEKSKIKNLTAYLSFRNENYIPLKDKIAKWKKKFKIIICLDGTIKKEYTKGFIQNVLSNVRKNSVVFLCGPEVMMKAVTEKLNKIGIENNQIYWSMERRMECGIGSCGRCLIQDVYVCTDGPVFRYDAIKSKLENEEASNRAEEI